METEEERSDRRDRDRLEAREKAEEDRKLERAAADKRREDSSDQYERELKERREAERLARKQRRSEGSG